MWTRRMLRADAERELKNLAEGWRHFGNDFLAAEADRALRELRSGSAEVCSGHILWIAHDD